MNFFFGGPSNDPNTSEKAVTADIYYKIFVLGAEPTCCGFHFLSVKPNCGLLEKCIQNIPLRSLEENPSNIHSASSCCVECLCSNDEFIAVNATKTLSTLFSALYSQRLRDFFPDLINIVCGLPCVASFFSALTLGIHTMLSSKRYNIETRISALELVIILACPTKNLHYNVLMDFLMKSDIFTDLWTLLCESGSIDIITPPARSDVEIQLVSHLLFLLLLFSHHQKYDKRNICLEAFQTLTSDKVDAMEQQIVIGIQHAQHLFRSTVSPEVSTFNAIRHVVTDLFSVVTSNQPLAPPIISQKAKFSSSILAILPLYLLLYHNPKYLFYATRLEHNTTNHTPISPKQAPLAVVAFFSFCSRLVQCKLTARYLFLLRLCFIIIRLLASETVACLVLHSPNIASKQQVFTEIDSVFVSYQQWSECHDETLVQSCLRLLSTFCDKFSPVLTDLNEIYLSIYRIAMDSVYRFVCFANEHEYPLHHLSLSYSQFVQSLIRILVSCSSIEINECKTSFMVIMYQAARLLRLFLVSMDVFFVDKDLRTILLLISSHAQEITTLFQLTESSENFHRFAAEMHVLSDFANFLTTNVFSSRSSRSSFAWRTAVDRNSINEFWNEHQTTTVLPLALPGKPVFFAKYAENPTEIAFFNQILTTLIRDYHLNSDS